MGGDPSRENCKDNERSARFSGGRSSGQVLGRPTAQWTGRGTRRKGSTLSKYEKLAPLHFIKSKDHYGRSNQGPMEVGARPRSILDQTIGGRSTDLFFYWFNTIGEKILQFPTETTETLNGSSARWAYRFCASFSWREQNNRERPGRPAQGARASFI